MLTVLTDAELVDFVRSQEHSTPVEMELADRLEDAVREADRLAGESRHGPHT